MNDWVEVPHGTLSGFLSGLVERILVKMKIKRRTLVIQNELSFMISMPIAPSWVLIVQ